jgi:NADP-reducing hydrogenase subunit HndB
MSPADQPGTGKIRGLADLQAIKERTQARNALREDGYHMLVTVHMGTCGIASGSRTVLVAMVDELAASGRNDIRVTTSGCIGACEREPVLTIETLDQPKVIYGDLTEEKTREIFREHVVGGKLLPQYVVGYGDEQ